MKRRKREIGRGKEWKFRSVREFVSRMQISRERSKEMEMNQGERERERARVYICVPLTAKVAVKLVPPAALLAMQVYSPA